MIRLLVFLIVFAVVLYAVWLVLGMMALPHPFPALVMLVMGVIFLVVLLKYLGIFNGGP